MVYVFYSGIVQLYVESDFKLTRLSVVISPYLTKFIKYTESNTAFLHMRSLIIFLHFFLSASTYVISSFNLRVEL